MQLDKNHPAYPVYVDRLEIAAALAQKTAKKRSAEGMSNLEASVAGIEAAFQFAITVGDTEKDIVDLLEHSMGGREPETIN